MSATTKTRPAGYALSARAGHPRLWLAARVLGALSLLAVGAVHLQQYFELYSSIPTIGTLFLLNVVGATPASSRLRPRSCFCSSASAPRCSASWSPAMTRSALVDKIGLRDQRGLW
jgi:hypothetical protein